MTTTLGDFTATDIDGDDVDLSSYDGQVVLVVNTASQCGMTPQYAGLQELYDDVSADGLVVLGFPCDQFGNQEPGSEQEIAAFCETSYGVTFPMFAKVEVNGDDAHPLYAWLQEREGRAPRRRHRLELHQVPARPRRPGARPLRPDDEPDELAPEVEKALAAE